MNRMFNKKDVSIVSILTLGLMHTTASAADPSTFDYVDVQKSRRNLGSQQYIFHGLLDYQLQMQGLYNQPILRFLQSEDAQKNFAGCKASLKKGLRVADNATEKSDTINNSTTAESRQSLRYSWRASRQRQVAQQHILRTLQDIDAVLNNRALKSIYGISDDDGRSEEEKIAEVKAEVNSEIEKLLNAEGADSDLLSLMTADASTPQPSFLGKSYQKLLDIYKDPNSTDYQKQEARDELQTDIKITQNFDEDIQRKISEADELSTIGKAHIEMLEAYKRGDSEEKLTSLIALSLSIHFDEKAMQDVLTIDRNVDSNKPIIDAYEKLKEDYRSGAPEESSVITHLHDLYLNVHLLPADMLTITLQEKGSPIRDAYDSLLLDFVNNESGENKLNDILKLEEIIADNTRSTISDSKTIQAFEDRVFKATESLTEEGIRDIIEENQVISQSELAKMLGALASVQSDINTKLNNSQRDLTQLIEATLDANFWGMNFSGEFGYKVNLEKGKLAQDLSAMKSASEWNDQITKPLDDFLQDPKVTDGFKNWLTALKENIAKSKTQFDMLQALKVNAKNISKVDAALGKLASLAVQEKTMEIGKILTYSYDVSSDSGYVKSADYMKGIAGPIGEQYPVIFRIIGESEPASLNGRLTGFNYFSRLSAGTGIVNGKSYIVKDTDGKSYEAKLELVLSSPSTEEPTTIDDAAIPTDTSPILGKNQDLGTIFKDTKGDQYIKFYPHTNEQDVKIGKLTDGDASSYETFYSGYKVGSATNTQGNKWAVKTARGGWVFVTVPNAS